MSAFVAWEVPGHLIRIELTGKVTIAEARAAEDRCYALLESCAPDSQVHVLVNAAQCTEMPTDLDILTQYLLRTPDPRAVTVCFVSTSRVFAFAAGFITRLMHTDFAVAKTVEEGLRFLSKRDVALGRLLQAPSA